MRPHVAVIGGGISGLAAAHHLLERTPNVRLSLLEAEPRLGGVVQTTERDGFLLEDAADHFFSTPPAAIDLCRRLGMADTLIDPDPARRQALVTRGRRLLPIPAGFHLRAPSRLGPMLTSSILSLRGKLRTGLECFLPGRVRGDDESLESFVCRRFGRELFERLVQPLVGGIYAADPKKLSIEATLPRFRQMEREHGSLIRALLRGRNGPQQPTSSGARYAQFVTPRGGMSPLVDSLAQRLPEGAVQCDSPVDGILRADQSGWRIAIGGAQPRVLQADGVIVAAPAQHAARIVEHVDAEIAGQLRGIEYARCAVVSLGYERTQIGHPLDGFGFVVPLAERRMILSCSFSSVKYEGRAPAGTVLLRVFIGGACQSGLVQFPRQWLVELAEREVADLLRIQGAPILRHIVRRGMPQYHVGHLARVASINARLSRFPTLALAGSALHGVGIPSCIQSGEAAAKQVAEHLLNDSRIPFRPVQV